MFLKSSTGLLYNRQKTNLDMKHDLNMYKCKNVEMTTTVM